MSTAIYRKYRPQLFADLIDQSLVKATLQNEIKSGRLAHAYLFSGPRGLGKTTTARLLAKAVNCLDRPTDSCEPCNSCSSCRAIVENRSLDLVEIDAASNRGINEIRQLKEHIGFTPAGGKYRVFIIDEVHMLTIEAFNALLKTLEEPPPHAMFILATTELHKVPETIISRCQSFVFRRVNEQHLVERLQKIVAAEGLGIDESVLRQVAHLSGGFIRDAESMLGQLISLGEKQITQDLAKLVLPTSNLGYVIKFLSFLHSAQIPEALQQVSDLSDEGLDLEYFAKELLEALRQLLIGEYGDIDLIDEHLRSFKGKFGVPNLLRLINLVDRAIKDLKRAEIPQLPLELVVVEFLSDLKPHTPVSTNAGLDMTDRDNASINQSGSGHEFGNQQSVKSTAVKAENNDSNYSTPNSENTLIVGRSDDVKIKKNKTKGAEHSFKSSKTHPTLTAIIAKWPQVIGVSQKLNHSLPMMLRMARPVDLTGSSLTLGFDYELHAQRVGQIETKQKIEKVLSEVFHVTLSVKARRLSKEEITSLSGEKKEQPDDQADILVGQMLETFGGQLVSD